MSPAGAGVRQFRKRTNVPYACTVLAVIALAAGVLLIPGSQPPARAAAPVAALPGWQEFQSNCESGPAPGQGSSPASCVCWESNLEAAAILPAFAVDVLNAAQVGGGPAYMTLENIGNLAIRQAAQGCGLYPEQA